MILKESILDQGGDVMGGWKAVVRQFVFGIILLIDILSGFVYLYFVGSSLVRAIHGASWKPLIMLLSLAAMVAGAVYYMFFFGNDS